MNEPAYDALHLVDAGLVGYKLSRVTSASTLRELHQRLRPPSPEVDRAIFTGEERAMTLRGSILLSAAVLTLGALACGPGRAGGTGTTENALLSEAQALEVVDQLNEALVSRDASRIKAYYAEDAVVMGLEAPAPFATRVEIDRDLDRFAGAGFDTYKLGSRRIQIIDGSHFVLTGVSTLGNSDTGESFPVRYSEVMARQEDGTWKIISEHISAIPGV